MSASEPREFKVRPRTIGQVEGIALVYGVVDSHETVFVDGCLSHSKETRLLAGRIRLFLDHGDSAAGHYYKSKLHIGTVRSLVPGRTRDGKRAEYMVADVFDTPAGREAMEYVAAVLANETETGLSVGFHSVRDEFGSVGNRRLLHFHAVDLQEISITAMASVPGAKVTAVRHGPVRVPFATEDERLAAVRESYRVASGQLATMADRLAAARAA